MKAIVPCLWFNKEAEEAVRYYCSIFRTAEIGTITRYGNEGKEIHGGKPGQVLTVEFSLNGQKFLALNGGDHFKFNEAISFQVMCESQAEVDHYWEKLSAGGPVQAQQCGWLKDKYGVSWQIVPTVLPTLLAGKDRAQADRVMKALLQMKKLDIAALQRAHSG
jgi:predicted 3-demethylubiquinone-9 3-methyltransferase (glyoxalase superfamily)